MMKHHKLKYNLGTLAIILGFIAIMMTFLNPVRADFNHAVFEGGKPNPMTNNQKAMEEIIAVNTQCYQNTKDSRVQQEYYVVCSIYDVKVSEAKTYRILGIMKTFWLLNP